MDSHLLTTLSANREFLKGVTEVAEGPVLLFSTPRKKAKQCQLVYRLHVLSQTTCNNNVITHL